MGDRERTEDGEKESKNLDKTKAITRRERERGRGEGRKMESERGSERKRPMGEQESATFRLQQKKGRWRERRSRVPAPVAGGLLMPLQITSF